MHLHDMCALYLQHDQVREIAEGVVRDVADAIECQGHRLQGGQVIEGTHWDLRQRVVIQPKMPEGPEAREGLWRDLHYQVGIQTPGWTGQDRIDLRGREIHKFKCFMGQGCLKALSIQRCAYDLFKSSWYRCMSKYSPKFALK